MGARTSGREAALQMLFAIESAGHSVERAIEDFWTEFPGDAEGRDVSAKMVQGVLSQLAELDRTITKASTNWRLDRMTAVDRNLLRVASYELAFMPEVPRAVVIDEAVDLAKRFGSENSGSFVNGVLNKVADLSGRPLGDETPKSESD